MRAARGPPNSPSRARESTGDAPRVSQDPSRVAPRMSSSRMSPGAAPVRALASTMKKGTRLLPSRRAPHALGSRVARARGRSRSRALRSLAPPRAAGDRSGAPPPPAPRPPDALFDDPFFADAFRASRVSPTRFGSLFDDDASSDASFSSDMFRAFRDADAGIDRLQRRLEEEATSAARVSSDGRTVRRESRSERQLPGGGYQRSYYSESVTTFGFGGGDSTALSNSVASPGLGVALLAGVLVGAYVNVASRLWRGWEKTGYETSRRAAMVLAWPWLWLLDAAGFRAQFARAFKRDPTTSARVKDREERTNGDETRTFR